MDGEGTEGAAVAAAGSEATEAGTTLPPDTGAAVGAQDAGGAGGEAPALPWRLQQAANREGYSEEDLAAFREARGDDWLNQMLSQRADRLDALSERAGRLGDPDGRRAEPDLIGQAVTVPDAAFEAFEEEDRPAIKALFEPVVKALNGMMASMALQECDGFFSALGQEYEKDFGKGRTNVRGTGAEQRARVDLIRRADRIARGYAASGQSVSRQDAMQEALSGMLGERTVQAGAAVKDARTAARAAKTTGAPGGRVAAPNQSREARKAHFVQKAEGLMEGTAKPRRR